MLSLFPIFPSRAPLTNSFVHTLYNKEAFFQHLMEHGQAHFPDFIRVSYPLPLRQYLKPSGCR